MSCLAFLFSVDNMILALQHFMQNVPAIQQIQAANTVENREQRTENREQRTENREQRTENREQRTENREQRTENRG
jgi:hypothetical protein